MGPQVEFCWIAHAFWSICCLLVNIFASLEPFCLESAPTPASVMNTRMRHETHNTDLHPTPTSKLIRDHYIKLVKNLALRDEVDLPPLLC